MQDTIFYFNEALTTIKKEYVTDTALRSITGRSRQQLVEQEGEEATIAIEEMLGKAILFTAQGVRTYFAMEGLKKPSLMITPQTTQFSSAIASTCMLTKIEKIYQPKITETVDGFLKRKENEIETNNKTWEIPNDGVILPSLHQKFPFYGLIDDESISVITLYRISTNDPIMLDAPMFANPLLQILKGRAFYPFEPGHYYSPTALVIHVESSSYNSYGVCINDNPQELIALYKQLPSLYLKKELSSEIEKISREKAIDTIKVAVAIVLGLAD